MFRSNVVFVGVGVLIGIIISTLFVNSYREEEISALSLMIRSELRDLSQHQVTSQQSSSDAKSMSYAQNVAGSYNEPGQQLPNIENIKQAFKEAAHDIVKEQEELVKRVVLANQAQSKDFSTMDDEISTVPQEISEQEQYAIEQSKGIIENAISAGQWDEASAQNFEKTLQDLSDKEQYEARVRLSAAINDGLITIDNAVNLMF